MSKNIPIPNAFDQTLTQEVIFKKQLDQMRAQLITAQHHFKKEAKNRLIIIFAGHPGTGKSNMINLLYQWLDPRHITNVAFLSSTEEENEKPRLFRYWRDFPTKGSVGIFVSSPYTEIISDTVDKKIKKNHLNDTIEEINAFEKEITFQNTLILKFWFQISKSDLKKKLKELESNKKTAWQVTDEKLKRASVYEDIEKIGHSLTTKTHHAWSPWSIIDASDEHEKQILKVGSKILSAFNTTPKPNEDFNSHPHHDPVIQNPVNELKLYQALSKKKYKSELAKWQGKLSELVREKKFKEHSVIMVFEGADASGKGSSIRRVLAALDARQYRVIPIAAPSEVEKSFPYLWRFWKHLPRQQRIAIFDRSWYGRVLVERVEKFCSESEWKRAYQEINQFEKLLNHSGAIVIKFWLQISKEEQLSRFKMRQEIPYKQYKITDEDWRNREKWNDYQKAVSDMVTKTHTSWAPWNLIEADNKLYARIKILKTICNKLKKIK